MLDHNKIDIYIYIIVDNFSLFDIAIYLYFDKQKRCTILCICIIQMEIYIIVVIPFPKGFPINFVVKR